MITIEKRILNATNENNEVNILKVQKEAKCNIFDRCDGFLRLNNGTTIERNCETIKELTETRHIYKFDNLYLLDGEQENTMELIKADNGLFIYANFGEFFF